MNWFLGKATCHDALSYGAPFNALVLLKKKDKGKFNLCKDYWDFNKVIVKKKYPIFLFADLFDRLGQAKLFKKIYWRKGYYHDQISKGYYPNIIYVTHYGSI